MSYSNSRDYLATQSNGDCKTDALDPNVTEVIVIRHGETEWNAQRRVQGQSDIELNDTGRQQAVAVAKKLSEYPKISAVYASDLKRAYETAEAIATSCGVLEVVKDLELRERHMGDLQGVIWPEALRVAPLAFQAFESGEREKEIPGGGESLDQFYRRATTSLQKIAAKHRGERIVVVTHGAYIEQLHIRASPQQGRPPFIANVSVNVLHLSGEDEWSIKVWAGATHSDSLRNGISGV